MTILNWKNASVDEKNVALARPSQELPDETKLVISDVFNAVRSMGDKALFSFTEQFDQLTLETLSLNLAKLKAPSISKTDQTAIKQAAKNIRTFHTAQLPNSIKMETMKGVLCEKQWRPIDTVGLYIPGGSAPLISTLLMLAIPAQIAGVKNIVVCTPPQMENDNLNPYILWAAKWLGIERIYTIGGAQAIAAMSLGTKTVPKVDKIFGPGNIWVTEAKRFAVSLPQSPAIDMPAGPSEVMVVADFSANPTIIAADLLAQAEHDPMSQAVLVSFSQEQINMVKNEVKNQLETLSRVNIARQAMENAVYILVNSEREAHEVINQYAPEHLIINMENSANMVEAVDNAGSIFVGPYSPESVGDYASGTNHVLPTSGFARSYSGLGTTSFMKSMTIQTLTKQGLLSLGQTVERLAKLEGLDAHAQAVTKRLAFIDQRKNNELQP